MLLIKYIKPASKGYIRKRKWLFLKTIILSSLKLNVQNMKRFQKSVFMRLIVFEKADIFSTKKNILPEKYWSVAIPRVAKYAFSYLSWLPHLSDDRKRNIFLPDEDLVFWANVNNSSTTMLFSHKKWSFRALFDLGDVHKNKLKISP